MRITISVFVCCVLLVSGCRKTPARVQDAPEKPRRFTTGRTSTPKYPLLRAYAKRHNIPDKEFRRAAADGCSWQQYVYDMSVSCGPNLSREEMKEFNAWRVK